MVLKSFASEPLNLNELITHFNKSEVKQISDIEVRPKVSSTAFYYPTARSFKVISVIMFFMYIIFYIYN